jgi:hypothetical protein
MNQGVETEMNEAQMNEPQMNADTRRSGHVTGAITAVLLAAGAMAGASDAGQLTAQPGTRGASRNESLDIACGPRAALVQPEIELTLIGAKEEPAGLFAPYHGLIVNGGTDEGVKIGQEYYVRRVVTPMDRGMVKPGDLIGIHTVGWIRITEAQEDRAIATTVHACDGFQPGDYLEPYTPPPPVPKPLDGKPDFEMPGRVVFGDERRAMGAGSNLMVIDLGTDNGIKPGQQFTVFRRTHDGTGPIVSVARGTAVAVSTESSMVRLDGARDAVYAGDFVAVHR